MSARFGNPTGQISVQRILSLSLLSWVLPADGRGQSGPKTTFSSRFPPISNSYDVKCHIHWSYATIRVSRGKQGILYLWWKHFINRGYGHIPTQPGHAGQPPPQRPPDPSGRESPVGTAPVGRTLVRLGGGGLKSAPRQNREVILRQIPRSGFSLTVDMAVSWESGPSNRIYR